MAKRSTEILREAVVHQAETASEQGERRTKLCGIQLLLMAHTTWAGEGVGLRRKTQGTCTILGLQSMSLDVVDIIRIITDCPECNSSLEKKFEDPSIILKINVQHLRF